jgi:type I restriction enzyme S subunit
MAKIKPYDEYKDSKNPFLNQVPKRWTESRFYTLVKHKSVINNKDEELLSVFLNEGVIKYAETSKMQVHKPSEDLSKYQLVEDGDFVLNNQQAWRGSVGVSRYRGIVSPAYYVFELSDQVNPRFANFAFRDSSMVDQLVLASKGVGSIQRNLYYPYLKNVIVSLPPKEEQEQIAKFLGNRLSKINRFIRAKKRQIELLKELKQAIINQAVTKGIDPNVPMKDSGVEWLGEIPEHWGQRKVKYLFDERVEKGYPDETLLAATQNKGVVPKHMYENRTVVAQKDLHLLKLVKKGDFVISLRSFQGGIEYAYYQGIISSAYTIMIPKNEIAPSFFKHLGKSRSFIELLKLCVTGIREGQNIDYNVLKNSMIPLPPKEEQDQIANFLDNHLTKIQQGIETKKKQIELLTEYRTSLISAVVTGKVDVRHIPIKDTDEFIEDMAEEEESEDVFKEEIRDKEVLICQPTQKKPDWKI